MARPDRVIRCWAASFYDDEGPKIVCVHAHDRTGAANQLKAQGIVVPDVGQIRPVTMVLGHDWWPEIESFAWYAQERIEPGGGCESNKSDSQT